MRRHGAYCFSTMKTATLVLFGLLFGLSATAAEPLDHWLRSPADWKGVTATEGSVALSSKEWSYLRSPEEYDHVAISATMTVAEPAKDFKFFGKGWSVWPDHTFGDGGYEAALV